MLRTLSAGMTALVVVAGSSLAYAQGPSARRSSRCRTPRPQSPSWRCERQDA
jgi:hypothetical protein